ncbi:hypothetical protein DICSQDRAFT_133136 [Dichomitus squalens LYAD-421 SS1]|uniref:uncharacterized protein n=1 Tax=Dichomitus squalens (strain LYAD-421) TaxID=732165 RepID=UPI00044137B8|nr:uncharacterized protein DICSQDRAFT_133136 [Dichomitus squalens LYAD-421 SS1]EJF65531.1 hypothetical protein DICSQDRAFT_133136 [Dichomitus squalens LYAD-421 SS1]
MFSLPLALCRQCTLWLPLRCRHARLDRGWGPMVSASTRCAALANTAPQQCLLHIYRCPLLMKQAGAVLVGGRNTSTGG